MVPIKLYDCEFVRDLTGHEFKRYITFLRLANYKKRRCLQATLPELEKYDGISPRRAHEIHPRLEERGMLSVDRGTNPYTYRLSHPSEWHQRGKGILPASTLSWSDLGKS